MWLCNSPFLDAVSAAGHRPCTKKCTFVVAAASVHILCRRCCHASSGKKHTGRDSINRTTLLHNYDKVSLVVTDRKKQTRRRRSRLTRRLQTTDSSLTSLLLSQQSSERSLLLFLLRSRVFGPGGVEKDAPGGLKEKDGRRTSYIRRRHFFGSRNTFSLLGAASVCVVCATFICSCLI